MSAPDFIRTLREKIGHDPLWLPAVTAVVLRDSTDDSPWAVPEVLLVKRADNGAWTPVTGICEPGENPDATAVREVKEETGLDVRMDALLGVGAMKPVVHANGDQATYMSIAMRLSVIGDDAPVVGDEENVEAGWFSVARMPVTNPQFRMMVADAAAQRKHPSGFTPRTGFHKRN